MADLQLFPGETVEDQAHIEEMVKKAEQGTSVHSPADKVAPVESPDSQQPLLAGKYTSEEDLQKGILELIKRQSGGNLEAYYKSLESQLGKQSATTGATSSASTEDQHEETPKENPPEKLEIQKKASQEGSESPESPKSKLDLKALRDEFLQEGGLKEATYDQLKEIGVTREDVDLYIEGQRALQERTIQTLTADIGGMDGFKQMSQWASKNLSEAQINAFNRAMDSQDLAQAQLAMEGLKAAYIKANGKAPNLLMGEASRTTGDTFRSMQELTSAMGDPRYGKDPAYTQDVVDKLSRSKL